MVIPCFHRGRRQSQLPGGGRPPRRHPVCAQPCGPAAGGAVGRPPAEPHHAKRRPTDAGRRLLERLRPALDEIAGALDDLNDERARPFGRLRIYTTYLWGAAVIAPVWARFLCTYPDVHLELVLDDAAPDIVARGFDAGIAPRDRVAADMIAVRVMAPTKVAIVGAPGYFRRRPPPRTPDDLAHHHCIQFRRGVDGSVFEWPFERDGRSLRISVPGRLMVNDPWIYMRAAVDGPGIAYTLEALAEPFLRSGQLVRVLEDWSPCHEGMFLYYPGHRQVPAALRALIDMIRVSSSGPPSERPLRASPFAIDGQTFEIPLEHRSLMATDVEPPRMAGRLSPCKNGT
jgi:DNA-binding transcriptional LysR family regulator